MADKDSPKAVAFYSTLAQAWVATRMEKDKTLLSLATAGIGLLATLATTAGVSSIRLLFLYGAAGVSFIVSVIAAILVFEGNSHHLRQVIRDGIDEDDPKLQRLDRVLFWSFVIGVILTGAIAIVSGYARISKGLSMTKVSDGRIETATVPTEGLSQKSLTGIGSIAPVSRPAVSTGTATQGQAGSGEGGSAQGAKK